MYKIFRNIIFIIAGLFLFIFPAKFEAHNGAKDELGGHFRKADCVYLLHDPTEIAKSASDMKELIQLIKKYNSNSSCTGGINEGNVDLEGYTFSSSPQAQQNEGSKPVTNVNTPQTSSEEIKLGVRYPAELVKCVDGDTAHFNINGQVYKTRFLYIDTPESTNKIEPFGKEASAFTCNFLKSGKITLETDGSTIYDKYNRLLAWVWVGDQLLQEEITKAGFVKDFYDYGDYLYEDEIISAMADAKKLSKGIYASQEEHVSNMESNKQSEQVKTEELEKERYEQPSDQKTVENMNKEKNEEEKQPDESANNEKAAGSGGNIIIGIIAMISLVFFFRKRFK